MAGNVNESRATELLQEMSNSSECLLETRRKILGAEYRRNKDSIKKKRQEKELQEQIVRSRRKMKI